MGSSNLLWLLLPVAFVALLVFLRRRPASGPGIRKDGVKGIGEPGVQRKKQRPKAWTPGEGLAKRELKDKMREMYLAQKFIKKHRELIDETSELVVALWALEEIYKGSGKSFSLDNAEARELLTAGNSDVAMVAQQQFEIGFKNCSRRLLNPRIVDNPDARLKIMEQVKAHRKGKQKGQKERDEGVTADSSSQEGLT